MATHYIVDNTSEVMGHNSINRAIILKLLQHEVIIMRDRDGELLWDASIIMEKISCAQNVLNMYGDPLNY